MTGWIWRERLTTEVALSSFRSLSSSSKAVGIAVPQHFAERLLRLFCNVVQLTA